MPRWCASSSAVVRPCQPQLRATLIKAWAISCWTMYNAWGMKQRCGNAHILDGSPTTAGTMRMPAWSAQVWTRHQVENHQMKSSIAVVCSQIVQAPSPALGILKNTPQMWCVPGTYKWIPVLTSDSPSKWSRWKISMAAPMTSLRFLTAHEVNHFRWGDSALKQPQYLPLPQAT